MKFKLWAIVIAVAIGIIGFFVLKATVFNTESSPQILDNEPDGINAAYDIHLKKGEQGDFEISSSVKVTNDSTDPWTNIGFYLVPNAMNSVETPLYEDEDLVIDISLISVDGEEADYELNNNELLVELNAELEPKSSANVTVEYSMVLPENGMRLSQVEDNYYLAHWYPMLGFYDDGWDIKDYDSKGESYDTDYGDFTVSYELSKDYLVASSGEDGSIEAASTGTVTGENIKDFYMAIMDPEEWEVESVQANETELRVFTPRSANMLEETSELAVDAFVYFEDNIGDNPFAQLDIISNDGYMEYPNIIEVAADEESQESVLVHEIAHQWFYFIVTNDPYNEAWLDEGLTEFSSSLFLSERYDDDEYGFWSATMAAEYYPPETYVNLPLDEFEEETYYSTIYGKVPVLLKEFFDDNGGNKAALEFLSAYYANFQFKQVDTEEFKEFFQGYFDGDQSEFLDSWLK